MQNRQRCWRRSSRSSSAAYSAHCLTITTRRGERSEPARRPAETTGSAAIRAPIVKVTVTVHWRRTAHPSDRHNICTLRRRYGDFLTTDPTGFHAPISARTQQHPRTSSRVSAAASHVRRPWPSPPKSPTATRGSPELTRSLPPTVTAHCVLIGLYRLLAGHARGKLVIAFRTPADMRRWPCWIDTRRRRRLADQGRRPNSMRDR